MYIQKVVKSKFLAEEAQRWIYTYIQHIDEDDFSMKLDSDLFVCVYIIHINKTLTLPVVRILFLLCI